MIRQQGWIHRANPFHWAGAESFVLDPSRVELVAKLIDDVHFAEYVVQLEGSTPAARKKRGRPRPTGGSRPAVLEEMIEYGGSFSSLSLGRMGRTTHSMRDPVRLLAERPRSSVRHARPCLCRLNAHSEIAFARATSSYKRYSASAVQLIPGSDLAAELENVVIAFGERRRFVSTRSA